MQTHNLSHFVHMLDSRLTEMSQSNHIENSISKQRDIVYLLDSIKARIEIDRPLDTVKNAKLVSVLKKFLRDFSKCINDSPHEYDSIFQAQTSTITSETHKLIQNLEDDLLTIQTRAA
ncbi:MAG: hypothetical protein VX112_04640 [Pseudomonadota bacterium]|nr:hypothetical protein [Pseudomonadota bacterium]